MIRTRSPDILCLIEPREHKKTPEEQVNIVNYHSIAARFSNSCRTSERQVLDYSMHQTCKHEQVCDCQQPLGTGIVSNIIGSYLATTYPECPRIEAYWESFKLPCHTTSCALPAAMPLSETGCCSSPLPCTHYTTAWAALPLNSQTSKSPKSTKESQAQSLRSLPIRVHLVMPYAHAQIQTQESGSKLMCVVHMHRKNKANVRDESTQT